MGRGFFSGFIWGSVISVMSLWLVSELTGVASLLSTPPEQVADTAPATGVLDGDALDNGAPVAPSQQGSPQTDPSRQGTALQPANSDTSPQADTNSAAAPVTGPASTSTPEPAQGVAPVLGVLPTDGTTLAPGAQPLSQPTPETAPQIPTSAPAPGHPNPETQTATPANPDAAPPDAQNVPQADPSPTAPAEPAQPAAPATDQIPVTSFSDPQVVATPAVTTAPPAEDANTTDTAPQTDTPPVAPAVKRAASVRTNLLPTIGGQAQAEEPNPEIADEFAPDTPAIVRFAQEFENPQGRPLMAVLLLVDGDQPAGAALPEALPFPVSYVIDASKDSANALMKAHRAAGHEVIMMAPLPEGATPRDVEVSFQTYLNAVPEAVVIMDTPRAVFQSGRIVATQVAEALAATGHGMITYSRGLNSANQVAERENVPAALVFRVFDDNGQDGAAIKRFMDQAAFRAGQQSGVILVGHERAETVTALLEWSLGNRASTVALAPVSAALLAQ